MKGYRWKLVSLGIVGLLAQAARAQDTAATPPAVPRCYRLIRGEWSRPLGVNAQYHALPALVRLDTAPALQGGWKVVSDIAFPTKSRFGGWPRWTRQADTLEIQWSTGFQVTTVRLGWTAGKDLRGAVRVWSDANEFGRNPPHASILARPVSCAELP